MAAAICVGLVLALIGFFAGDDHTDGAVITFVASVAVLAGALIYLLATDDFEARKQIFGPEAADRRDKSGAED
jgi:hypothetical protein